MTRFGDASFLIFLWLLTTIVCTPAKAARGDGWTAPTSEELSMTSQTEVPGASAVYLLREEGTYDNLRLYTVYIRIKVLTEAAKDLGNVEVTYNKRRTGFSVTDISGRTVHADGTVVPFTGKPYDKLIEKTRSDQYMAKVFSLPDVQVGSILEYRYSLRYDDTFYIAPNWYVQSDLFIRRAHFLWQPTDKPLLTNDGHEQLTNAIAWTPILPAGVEVKRSSIPSGNFHQPQQVLALDVSNVPPAPREEFMPPIDSLSYRVLFYYTPYATQEEFWKKQGKYWAKDQDKFIGPGPGVRGAVGQLTLSSDTPAQKLKKLYAAVEAMENTSFTRERTAAEEQGNGLGLVRSTDDILARKRGTDDQLTELFVAMVRAAGMKSYLMAVADRNRHIFFPPYLSLRQLDDDVAIVIVDGKEQFFDPGSPFCAFGHLSWRHASAGGLRQTEAGSELVVTPTESYKSSFIKRIADLHMDEHGSVTGIVKMTYEGAPAFNWRQRSLQEGRAGLERQLHDSVAGLLPSGLDLHLTSIDRLPDADAALEVSFEVKGTPGTPAGKRLLLTGDLFEAQARATFPHPKRELAVYFDYPSATLDAVRIHLPPQLSIESLPEKGDLGYGNYAHYNYTAESTPDSYTIRRNYSLGETIFLPKDYAELRTFYSKIESKDRQSVVLKAGGSTPAKSGSGGN